MQIKTGRQIVLGMLGVGLGVFISRQVAANHEPVWVAVGWAMGLLVALKLARLLWRAGRAVRAQAGRGVSLDTIYAAGQASSPPWTHGLMAMERRAYGCSWRALAGKPIEQGGRFGVAAGPQGGSRTLSLLLTVALCGAALGYCLPMYVRAGWPLLASGAALLLLVLYALVWIVGERRSLKEGGHRIEGECLHLDLGLRGSATIPLTAIASCAAIGGRARSEGAWCLTPGETPNVILELREDFAAVVRGSAQQVKAARALLYLDQPAAFVAALAPALAGRRLAAVD